jgi:hypothetical protein
MAASPTKQSSALAVSKVGESTSADFDPSRPPNPGTPTQLQRRAFARISDSLGDERRGVAWYNADDDSTHLPVVGMTDSEISKLQAEGQRQMATKLVIEPGSFSVAALEEVRDAIVATLGPWASKETTIAKGEEGNHAYAGLSTDRGKPFVRVVVTPEFEARARSLIEELTISEKVGGDQSIVQLSVEPLGVAENWSGPSLDGGDWISVQGNGPCSAGWITGPEMFWGITAGHCLGINNLNNSVSWTNAAANQVLQSISPAAGWSSYSSATFNSVANDVAAFGVPYGAWQPYAHNVWDGFPRVRTGGTSTRTVGGLRTDESNMVIGLQVCHSGWGSKAEKCGTINGQNYQDYAYLQQPDTGLGLLRLIDGVYSANYSSAAGDSGGPVYWKWTYTYVGQAEPTGIHISQNLGTGTRYFETLQDIENLMGRYTVAQSA